jgi:hypothetical protein
MDVIFGISNKHDSASSEIAKFIFNSLTVNETMFTTTNHHYELL